jgi:hypothetical protein
MMFTQTCRVLNKNGSIMLKAREQLFMELMVKAEVVSGEPWLS